ncbi:MAG: transglycosylase domain-containing protein [Polyangiaceae bacterium]|nr:transglycosylase domain-containing protein [Polyangiaceae bacterium]
MRRPRLERLWPPPWRAIVAQIKALNPSRLPRGPRWAAYGGLSLGALLALTSLAAYLLTRSSIRNLEQRFHASISIGTVLPCGVGICARGVRVRFEDAPGLVFEAQKIRLSSAPQNDARLLLVDGAKVSWRGSLAQIEAQAQALGQRIARSAAVGEPAKAKGSSGDTMVHATGASFDWQSPDGDGVQAQGIEFERAGGELRLLAEEAHGSLRQNVISLAQGRASLRRVGSSTRLVAAEAHELRIEQSQKGAFEKHEKATDDDAEITPSQKPGSATGVEKAPSQLLGRTGEAGQAPSQPLGKTGEAGQAPSHKTGKADGAERAPRRVGRADEAEKASQKLGRTGEAARAPSQKARKADDAASSSHGASLLDKAKGLRESMPQVRAALAQIELVSVEDARVSIDALYATFVRGGVTVHLGPNTVNAFRTPTSFRLDVTPQAVERGPTSLKLGVEVPNDVAADVRVSLTGGPVPLAALGLRKGDLGLLDVEHSLVEAAISTRLTGDGRHASAEVDAKLHDLSVEQPALSSEPIRGAELRLRGDVELETDGSSLVVERGELGVGRATVAFAGSLLRPGPGWSLRGRLEVPSTPCQAALDALPAGLSPMLAGMRMDGAFSLVTAVDFDSSRPEHADVHFALGNGCKIVSVPPQVDVSRFREPFRRRVYGPDRARVELEMGPGTPGWVRYGAISPFMTAAVLTTEDGGFRHHRGFDAGAIRNSIRDNLREGRFLRGASTITMQTVKNLYLEREKTLGRKIQEAVLTVYLEQALTKEEILELYFNCIEFGPMLYGIGPAAGHYFHSTPGALSLGQALYLSSILPNPKNNYFGPDGRVKPHWMSYLRKLMQIMVKRHLIDESELRLGASEWIVFGEPAPLREEGPELDSADEVYPTREGP